ncbi:unnamed protein product [Clonostachys rhizophaga]|uniref:Uncharacterized protein n=1 Tax=Clonostachys rhizophaga TaxID=160324 RepID=A0A9N9VKD3_9HYPO|nr:unnamed protein product [Clonostachys rhizophaga]
MASTLSGSAYAYILPSRWHRVFTTKAQLLTAPSVIFTVIFTYIRAGQATSVKSMRGPVIIMARGNRSLRSAPCGCVGYADDSSGDRLLPYSKRAVSAATCMMGGGVGSIIA